MVSAYSRFVLRDTDRYAVDEPVDIVIQQVKEKFACLRFYYSYEDAACPIQAFDCLGDGISIRFQPENKSSDEKTKKLRSDIAQIVRSYEEKSRTICENLDNQEICGWICLGKEHCVMIAMKITCKKFKKRNKVNYGLYR